MDSFGFTLGAGLVVFVATDIDDLLVLAALFADSHLARSSVVIGQFVGIGAVVLVSAVAALLAVTIPDGWIALSGLAPLLMGLFGLREQWRSKTREAEEHQIQETEHRVENRLGSQILGVSAVTIANSGDNLGVYIPLFAATPANIPIYAVAFATMTAVWCACGYYLVNHVLFANVVSRYGHVALPYVLIALGLYILSGALPLVSGM